MGPAFQEPSHAHCHPRLCRHLQHGSSTEPLSPWSFDRRDPGPDDVAIEIKFAGVCHSDLHIVKNDLGRTRYPIVPGHEIAGVVSVGLFAKKAASVCLLGSGSGVKTLKF